MVTEEGGNTSLMVRWQDALQKANIKVGYDPLDPYELSKSKIDEFHEAGILTRLPSHPSILDYGADNGVLGVMMAVKLNASSLVQADQQDRRLPAIVATTTFVRAERNKMPDTSDRFDVVLLSDVLHFIPAENRIDFLASMAQQHLTSKGRILVLEYNVTHQEAMRQFREQVDREKTTNSLLQQISFIVGKELPPEGWKPASAGFRIVRKTH